MNNIIINIEDIRIEGGAGNGVARREYAYDGYDYEAEKLNWEKIMIV
jgi:hypothetical protein